MPAVGEFKGAKRLVILSKFTDSLERRFFHDRSKRQPLVAVIGGTRPPVEGKSATLGCTNRLAAQRTTESPPLDARKPIGVATYRTVKRLPRELQGQLPAPEEIAKLLEDAP